MDGDDEMWELAMRPAPHASQQLDWLAPDSEEEDCASGALMGDDDGSDDELVATEATFRFPSDITLRITELHTQADAAAPLSRMVGGEVWEAALLLGTHLCATAGGRALVHGRRVHELGAGVGLPGLVALACGARGVVLSDYPPQVVQNMRANARRNPAQPSGLTAHAIKLDWRDANAATLPEPQPEPEPEPEAVPSAEPEAFVQNLTTRQDLNYPTAEEVRFALRRAGGVAQVFRRDAVDHLRKAGRDRPERAAPVAATVSAGRSSHDSDGDSCDLVIGAALVYGPHHAEPLATCIAQLLHHGSVHPPPSADSPHAGGSTDGASQRRALIVQIPTRPGFGRWERACEAHGLTLVRRPFPEATYALAEAAFPELINSPADDFEMIEVTVSRSIGEGLSVAATLDADEMRRAAAVDADEMRAVTDGSTSSQSVGGSSPSSSPLQASGCSPGFRAVPAAPGLTSSESDDDADPFERTVRAIFDFFDTDRDGYHSLEESQALAEALNQPAVTREGYDGLCKDLLCDGRNGIDLRGLMLIYSDGEFGANLAEDYSLIFGEAPP